VELSKGGTQALQIGQDEHRTFLEDGDTVDFRGWCERPGAVTIGFGDLSGRYCRQALLNAAQLGAKISICLAISITFEGSRLKRSTILTELR